MTIKLDRNWNSFQLANSAPPLSVTDSAIAPSARMSRTPCHAQQLHRHTPEQVLVAVHAHARPPPPGAVASIGPCTAAEHTTGASSGGPPPGAHGQAAVLSAVRVCRAPPAGGAIRGHASQDDCSWAEARIKIARMTLTIKLDRNWRSFQLANSAPPLSVTDSAIAPSARMGRAQSRAPRLCRQPPD